MQVREIVEDDVHILQIAGEIDLAHSPELRDVLHDHAKAKRNALLLDFQGVEYIDSSGLATLVEYVQKSSVYGGKFALASVKGRVRTVIDLVRLGEIFGIY